LGLKDRKGKEAEGGERVFVGGSVPAGFSWKEDVVRVVDVSEGLSCTSGE
jgi:hypothetical protein